MITMSSKFILKSADREKILTWNIVCRFPYTSVIWLAEFFQRFVLCFCYIYSFHRTTHYLLVGLLCQYQSVLLLGMLPIGLWWIVVKFPIVHSVALLLCAPSNWCSAWRIIGLSDKRCGWQTTGVYLFCDWLEGLKFKEFRVTPSHLHITVPLSPAQTLW